MAARASPNAQPRIVATYPYRDENGALLFEVVRYEPKAFKQRQPDGKGGFLWNLNGVRRVPYRLPELLSSVGTVYVMEGEKDADRLARLGLTATCNAEGAGKWLNEFSRYFAGRDVVILADNDGAGLVHAQNVAANLFPVAQSVRVVWLPGLGDHGDVSDWLDQGHTKAELLQVIYETPAWTPPEDTNATVGVLLSDVRPERVEWLWPGYIPLGKITMLDGDPGFGKSLLTLEIAARISCGEPLRGADSGISGGVVILSAEDGLGDTIRPRLEAAGANLQRILALKYAPDQDGEKAVSNIPVDIPTIRQAIVRVGAKLLTVDVLMAYLPSQTNTYRDQDIRLALAPLAQMAAAENVAVVCIRHLTKALGGNPLYRGGGSIGIIGGARSGLLVARDPDQDGQFVLAQTKSNLGPPMPSLSYRIEATHDGIPRIVWMGSSSQTAASLLAATLGTEEERGALADAKEFLLAELEHGPQATKELWAKARKVGISNRTLDRAKAALQVQSTKVSFASEWRWQLPATGEGCEVSTRTVRAFVHRGELEGRIIANQWRFRSADVDRFVEVAPAGWDFDGKRSDGD